MRRAVAASVALVGAALLARSASTATGDPLDRSLLGPMSFQEDFRRPTLDFYEPSANPHGRWTTCYWFGWRPGGGCPDATSRTIKDEPAVFVDPAYDGTNPFVLSRGALSLTLHPTRPGDPKAAGRAWAGGLLTTQASFAQRYGYFETRTAFPAVRGAWGAFWLLPADNHTPQEIDVVEALGGDPDRVLCTPHWTDGSDSPQSVAVEGVARPHTYGLLWTAETLAWYVDGREVKREPNRDLHGPMYLLVSLGVGGWPGSHNLPPDVARLDGAAARVEWVRAYPLR